MGPPTPAFGIIDGRYDWVRTQDHARAAAVGRIVDLTMPTWREVPRVGPFDDDQAICDSLSQQAGLKERSEYLGKQRDDLNH
jgi:hypothetical protein